MHVRFSTCVGTNVTVENTEETVGRLYDMLIHPDTGKIEGFFVEVSGFFSSEGMFLSVNDIVRWGTRVMVSDSSDVCEVEDHIRLQSLLQDPRRVLGQSIRTESGKRIGTCKDVQFDTTTMHIEWIFPKRLWKWGTALPVTEILEVTPRAIIVRDPALFNKQKVPPPKDIEVFDQLPGVTRSINSRNVEE